MSRHVRWRAACRSLGFSTPRRISSLSTTRSRTSARARDHAGRGARAMGQGRGEIASRRDPTADPRARRVPSRRRKRRDQSRRVPLHTPRRATRRRPPRLVVLLARDRRGVRLGALAVHRARAFPRSPPPHPPRPAVAAPREVGCLLRSRSSCPRRPSRSRTRARAPRQAPEDAKASSGRRRASSDSKLGTHADADERSVGLGGSRSRNDLVSRLLGGRIRRAPPSLRRVRDANARETKHASSESRDETHHGRHGRARPRGEPQASVALARRDTKRARARETSAATERGAALANAFENVRLRRARGRGGI